MKHTPLQQKQFENGDYLGLFGVPVLVSEYTPADTILLIGKKKRPYSPLTVEQQDRILGPFSEWGNQLMGVIKLKSTGKNKDSWISKKHTLTQIRGREETIAKLIEIIEHPSNSKEKE